MSRLRSARGASAGGRATPARAAGAGRGVFVQTPKSDIYVVMLAIALGAMVLGCLLLLLLLGGYGFELKPTALGPGPMGRTALAHASGFFSTVHL